MKTWFALGLLILAMQDQGESAAPLANLLRSVSGQFVVIDRRAPVSFLPPPARDKAELELSPPFLVVSCERIKQALATELGMGREWSGAIQVSIRSNQRTGNVPSISVERFGRRWLYKVELPERLERRQLVRTLVQVLLLEFANRTPSEHSAEIPLWLSEGLAQRLAAAREMELLHTSPSVNVGRMMVEPTMIQTRDPDPLARAREVLRKQAPPTLAELSWPEVETFSPAATELFQMSAQVFVTELLRLQDGPELLRRFIASLPRYFNWQTAFLRAYEREFPNQLALEKWWALQAAHFVGRDHKQLWTPDESAQKLAELLQVAVAVRLATNDLPTRTDISLQTVLREWDTMRQMQVVQTKLKELELALPRVAPTYIALVNDYHIALTDFMAKRSRTSATFGWMQIVPPSAKQAVENTVARLDALDVRRQSLATNTAAIAAPAENAALK
jgi:hypothetical protein